MSGDPQPSIEERQSLLRDVRSVRDAFSQDRTRLENQLLAAQQTISTLTTELGIADQRLTTVEDLIGEVRHRMQARGLSTNPAIRRPRPKGVTLVPADDTTNVCVPREFFITFHEFTPLTPPTVHQQSGGLSN